jgi:Tol biopolymer transport system component
MIQPAPDTPNDDVDARIWSVLTESVQQFEESWEAGSPRPLADLLPDTASDFRRRVLLELAKVDQEFRWKSGDHKRTEAYLAEWPELGGEPEVLVELLEAECLTRAVLHDLPTAEELRRRFPDIAPHVDLRKIQDRARDEVDAPYRWKPIEDPSISTSAGRVQDVDAVPPLQVGDQFGRYEVKSRLGEGGMGWVYHAYDTLLQRDVALKIPRFDSDVDPVLVRRFLRESRAAARIEHPNICTIYDTGDIDGIYYITMRRVRGQSLAQRLERGPLPPVEAAQLTHKLASALSAIHSHGIVHRDIKTSNILLDEAGEPLLTDFGLARLPEVSESESQAPTPPVAIAETMVDTDVESNTGPLLESPPSAPHSAAFVGTIHYMAPELLYNHPPDARSDIYSLGVVLYRMLSGCLPFLGKPHEVAEAIESRLPPPPSQFEPRIPPELEAICLKTLAKDPEERYQSAAEMAAALRLYMDPVAKAAHDRKVAGERRKMRLAGVCCLLATAALLVVFIGPGSVQFAPIDRGAQMLADGEEVFVPPGETTLTIPLGFGRHEIVVSGPTFEKRVLPIRIRWRGDRKKVSAGAVERRIETLPSGRSVVGVCRSPDSSTLYAAYNNYPLSSPVQAFDVATGKLLATYNFPNESYDHKGIAISWDGRYLFVTNYHEHYDEYNEPPSFDRTNISRIDLQQGGKLTDLDVGGFWGTDLATTADGRWLVVSLGGDRRSNDLNNDALAIVDISDGRFELAAKVPLDDEPFDNMLALAPDSRRAYVVTRKRKSPSPRLYEVSLSQPFQVTRHREFPDGDLRNVAVSSNLQRIFVADTGDKTGVHVIDSETFEEVSLLELPATYKPTHLALHPRDELLAVLCHDSRTLFLLNPKTERMLAQVSGLDADPGRLAFSPDGKRLWLSHCMPRSGISVIDVSRRFDGPCVVFTSNRDGEGQQLYHMNADGTAITRLAAHHGNDSSVRWSPDGKRIAFMSDRDGQPRIYVADEFAQQVKSLERTDPAADVSHSGLDWSANGSQIVFVADEYRALRIVDVATGDVRTILSGPAAEGYARHTSVSWNRANGRIFFNSQHPGGVSEFLDLFSVDPQSGNVSQVTDQRGKSCSFQRFSVSPDGKRIAAVYADRARICASAGLYIMQSDGSEPTPLVATGHQFCGMPRWSSDGKYLYYAASNVEHGQRDLFRVPVDGGPPEQLTRGDGDDVDPDVSVPR